MPAIRSVCARRLAALAALSVVTAFATGTGVAQAASPISPTFFGVVADGPMLNGSVDLGQQFDRMVANGVGTVRIAFPWTEGQFYRDCTDPAVVSDPTRYTCESGAHGELVPTDYTHTDEIVAAAAQRHIALLPVVEYAPGWAAWHPGDLSSSPQDPAEYAAYLRLLVHRYGRNGTFWTLHPELPKVPIRYWQIWNEPSFYISWKDQPFAADYVKLLKASRVAAKAEDPGAQIVLAGVADSHRGGYLSWQAIEKIYKAGGRKYFDVVCDHPFTPKVDGVRTILQRIRQVMAKYHDGSKPLWVTELSWTSAKGKAKPHFGNDQDEKGQARTLAAAYKMLVQYRYKLHIGRVYWFTWMSRDSSTQNPFDYSGLYRLSDGQVQAKSAASSYEKTALAFQRCKIKKGRADRCTS